MYILPQIAQIMQRNAASCIITQRKTDWVGGEFYVVLLFWGFVCVNLRDLREILGFRLCGLIEYSCVCILPQIAQMTQRNAASCIISQRKTVCSLFCIVVCLRLSAWSARDLLGFIYANRLSTLAWIFSRRYRRWRRGIQHGCIISQRKTGCLKLRLFCCFGVLSA